MKTNSNLSRLKFNFAFVLCLVFFAIGSLAFVSAVSYPTDFQDFIGSIFEQGWVSDLMFERILIFILLFTLIFMILSKTPMFEDQKANSGIIALAVSLIAVRYLSEQWLQTIVFQYGVLAVAINSILPFILYFLFLQTFAPKSPGLRKAGWVMFAVVYFFLWATSEVELYASIYWWTLLASLAVLFLDGTIQRYLLKEQFKAAGKDTAAQRIAQLEREIRNLDGSSVPQREKDRITKDKQKQIKRLHKYF